MELLVLPIFLVFGLISLGTFIFWIWSIIDCAQNEPSEGNDKIIWIIILLFLNFLGSLIYYFARRPERIRKYGR